MILTSMNNMAGAVGGGGGGVSLSGVPLQAVDLATGWTQLDPDSIVSSLSVASGVHTATMAALAGSSDYSLLSGANYDAFRAYRNLEDADGTRITTEDDCIVYLRMTYETPGTAFEQQLIFGICEAPTTQTAASLNGMGLTIQRLTTSVRRGMFSGTAATISTASAYDVSTALLIRGGRYGDGGAITADGSGNGVDTPQRNSFTPTAATDLSLVLGIGVQGTGAVAGGSDCKFKAWYQVVKFTTV